MKPEIMLTLGSNMFDILNTTSVTQYTTFQSRFLINQSIKILIGHYGLSFWTVTFWIFALVHSCDYYYYYYYLLSNSRQMYILKFQKKNYK